MPTFSKVDLEGLVILPCGNFKSGLGRSTSILMSTLERDDLKGLLVSTW